LGLEFRAHRGPEVPPTCPPDLEAPAPAVDDLEPYLPGSLDDVEFAYDLGLPSANEYEFLAEEVSVTAPGPG
jgi:hypothetical protein